MGGHLIFIEPRAEQLLLHYDPETKRCTRLLPHGKAANECMNVHQIGYYPAAEKEAFYVFDNYQNRIFFYTLQNELPILNHISTILEGIKTFSFLTANKIWGCATDSSRYVQADTCGTIDYRFGDYQEYGLSIPIGSGLLQGLSVTNALSTKQERYAWFSFYGIGYQILECKPDSCKIIAGTLYQLPKFQVHSNSGIDYPTFEQNTVVGYPAVTTDGSYIYALYSGQKLQTLFEDPDRIWRSRSICIYDWDGQPQILLQANRDLKTLAYDQTKDRLYALSLTEEGLYELVFLDLSDLRKNYSLDK